MADPDPNTEDIPGLDDTDAQDLQASTFQYGVVKTQQQLMMKNPHINRDLYDEGTIDEEDLDENHNGIPDNEEDRVGTFLRGTEEGIVETLHAADWDYSQIDKVFDPGDQNILDPSSSLNHALKYVQERAPIDPQAQELLDNYNRATDAVQSALDASHKSQSSDNFLDLKLAELDRTLAKADIAKYEAGAQGHSDELARAEKWHDMAQSMRDNLAKIKNLPPEEQQAALDKLTQENQKSRIAREWTKFKAGDLSKWDNQDNGHVDADSPDYPSSNNYQTPNLQGSSNLPVNNSPWSLSSIFGNWAMPWSPSQPASTNSSKSATQASKTDDSWSLTSIFGNWALPGASSTPASKPAAAAAPATEVKKEDSSWSLTSVFSNWSWPWSASKTPTPSTDPKKQTAAPTVSGP